MDSIISKLSEVESAAELIVQHAEEQKHILDEQMKEKRTSLTGNSLRIQKRN